MVNFIPHSDAPEKGATLTTAPQMGNIWMPGDKLRGIIYESPGDGWMELVLFLTSLLFTIVGGRALAYPMAGSAGCHPEVKLFGCGWTAVVFLPLYLWPLIRLLFPCRSSLYYLDYLE